MNELTKKGHTLQNESMTSIDKLFHVASMPEHGGFEDMLDEMEFWDFHEFIPSLTYNQYKEYGSEKVELLHDYEKVGFFAKCDFNVPQNFSFGEDGRFRSCSNSCYFYPFYIYAESMEELLNKIMLRVMEMFENEANKARKDSVSNTHFRDH